MGAPPDEQRCRWVKPNAVRCHQPRSEDDPTGDLCTHHVRERTRRLDLLRRAEDVPDMSVEEHIKLQLRTAYVMVRLAEMTVLDLGLDKDAFLHPTEETEERSADTPEGSYVSVKRATLMGAHPAILVYLKEREHHLKVVQLCVSAGLAARQIAAVERFAESLVAFGNTLAEALGHDPHDAETRRIIIDAMSREQRQMEEVAPRALEG